MLVILTCPFVFQSKALQSVSETWAELFGSFIYNFAVNECLGCQNLDILFSGEMGDDHAVSPEKAPLLSCLGNFTHGASVLCRGWGKETEGPRDERRAFPLCPISAFRASYLSVWSFCGSVFPENKASFFAVG